MNLKAYLTYPRDTTTNGILLNTKWVKLHEVTFKGLTVYSYNKFTGILIEDLKNQGAIVDTKEAESYSGKSEVFGIPAKTEILNSDLIRVRVEGENLERLMDNIKTIKEGMGRYGYRPKVCQWDRVGRLGL